MGRHRERESGMGLLPRMEACVGKTVTSYRYHPIGAKPIGLGRDRVEAIRKVLDLLGKTPDTGTVKWVWERYQNSKRFKRLADATQTDYQQCSVQIIKILGAMPIGSLTAPMVAKYVHIEREDAPTRANREKALLSNLFAHGILLGVCESNPAKSVQPHEEEPRTEAPNPAVLLRFLEWVMTQTPQRQLVGLAARFASLAGSRKVEFLDLAWPQVDSEAGVMRIKRAKQRGKKRGEVIEEVGISPALEQCLTDLRTLRTDRDCLYVFPTRDGNAYSASGFKTLWGRIVLKAIDEKVISKADRFTFHDLRAAYATTHKREHGVLPDLHKNPATTAGIYDRNKIVKRKSL